MEKVNELIKQEVARLLEVEVEWPTNWLVTVTKVKTLPDLKQATVYLSVFPFNQTGTALHLAGRATRAIQEQLNNELTTHTVPKIRFVIDSTEQRAAAIDEVLDSLKNE